jgi:hypothetical protein
MHLLNIMTITSAGLMVGNELSGSTFVNPALRRLESGPQAQALSVLARSLAGRCLSGTAFVWRSSPWSRACISIRLRSPHY